MKKLLHNIVKICCAALVSIPFVACQEEDNLVKPVSLLADPSLTFEAIGAEPQSLTIASDGCSWVIDVPEDWVTLDKVSGTQSGQVTVTVADNAVDGVMGAPRQCVLTIDNGNGYSVTTTISQKGDNYLGVAEMGLSDVAKLEDGKFAKVKDAQVVALTADGFVATDAGASMYVEYDGEVSLGDNVFIAGEKSVIYGLAALKAGEVTVNGSAEVSYPTAADLLSNLDPAKATSVAYVSVEAGLLGRDLRFEESVPVSIVLLDPKSGTIDLDAVNMHNIAVEAYFVGLANDVATLAVVSFEDKGINDNLKAYFYDDFSWMKSYIDASGVEVGDSVGDNKSDAKAPNLRTTGALEGLLNALLERGYEELNPDAKVIYPQKYYWKFGKSSNATENNNNGIILPALDLQGETLINVDIDFDWAAHMTGGGNIDKVSIVVELAGSGTFSNGTQISDPFVTTQEKGNLEWQHVSVMAKGVNNTTRFTIRPLEYASVTPDQQRWHLDNIKISDSDIPYSEPVYADVTVSDEVVTFDGNPAAAHELKISSDMDWTLTKDADWFDISVAEGFAGQEVSVNVTCRPNNTTKLRHGVIALTSADTHKNIHIVQNSGGSELDPLISISSGNNVTVLGQGDSFEVKVQANVEFETEIVDEWITEVEVPATKAMVETTVKSFKAAPNLTGADRIGTVRFHSGNIESVLKVTQEKFEPAINVSPVGVKGMVVIPAAGGSLKVDITSNVAFDVASDVLTLPVSSAPAGTHKDITIDIPANDTGISRTVVATFTNDEYEYKYEFSILQLGEQIFFDDFSWLAPLVSKWNAANSGKQVGDTIGSNGKSSEAPNVYTDESLTDFISTMTGAGYEDMCPSKKVLYLQDEYLKLGRTGGNNTSLRLPSLVVAGPVDVVLDFDHAAMCQGSGTVDDSKIVVVIEGSGEFENGTKYSDPLALDQAKSTYNWTHSYVKIKGMSDDTRLVVVMYRVLKKGSDGNYNGEYNYSVSGAGRIFIDNIRISK